MTSERSDDENSVRSSPERKARSSPSLSKKRRSSLRRVGIRVAVIINAAELKSSPAATDPYACHDVLRITAVLSSCGFAAHLFQGTAATKKQIVPSIRRIYSDIQEPDTLFFLAVAPCRQDSKGQPCLLLHDAHLRDEETWLPLSTLTNLFPYAKATNKLGIILALPINDTTLVAARTTKRRHLSATPIAGEAFGVLHLITPTGNATACTWPGDVLEGLPRPPEVLHQMLITLLGRDEEEEYIANAVLVLNVLHSFERVGVSSIDLPSLSDEDVVVMDRLLHSERFGEGSRRRSVAFAALAAASPLSSPSIPLSSNRATAVVHYTIHGLADNDRAVVHAATAARDECTAILGIQRKAVSTIPVTPGNPDQGEHWAIVALGDQLNGGIAGELGLSLAKVHPSVAVERVWMGLNGRWICFWFSSDQGVHREVLQAVTLPEGIMLRGPHLIGAARFELSVDSFYALERRLKGMWPVFPTAGRDSVDGIQVSLLCIGRWDVSLKELMPPSSQSPPPVGHDSPKIPQIEVKEASGDSPRPRSKGRMEFLGSREMRREALSKIGGEMLNANWSVEDKDNDTSSSEEERGDGRREGDLNNTVTSYTPINQSFRESFRGSDFFLGRSVGELGQTTHTPVQPFKASRVALGYGERGVRFDYLKVGDRISLLSSADGLLAACWQGDVCSPVAQRYFGKSQAPLLFERCVFQVEKFGGAEDRDEGFHLSARSKSEPSVVNFGMPVRLTNVYTSRYLCTIPPPANKLVLAHKEIASSQFGDSSMVFKFLPSTRMRTEGEKVRVGDCVMLMSQTANCLVAIRESAPPPSQYFGEYTFPPPSGLQSPGGSRKGLPPTPPPAHDKEKQSDLELLPVPKTMRKQLTPPKASLWTVAPYFIQTDAGTADDSLHTGSAVLLFHKEAEGFLTADSELLPDQMPVTGPLRKLQFNESAAQSISMAFTGDSAAKHVLYCDVQSASATKSSTYVLSDLPHSANALWLLEFLDPCRGGPVQWVQQRKAYRIKHIATGGYLCVVETGRGGAARDDDDVVTTHDVSMTNDPDDPNSIVVFFPVNTPAGTSEEGGMLATSSFSRIQFARTRFWLHMDMTTSVGPVGSSATSTTTLRPQLTRKALYNAVFAIRVAPHEELEQLSAVTSMRRTLGKFISAWLRFPQSMATLEEHDESLDGSVSMEDRRASITLDKPCVQDEIALIEGTVDGLGNLIRFCSQGHHLINPAGVGATLSDMSDWDPFAYHGAPDKSKQLILFSQNLHVWVLKMLQVPFHYSPLDPAKIRGKRLLNIFQLCYRLLKQMIRGQTTLALRLAPYIPFIESQLPLNFNAIHTLVQIYRDNYRLLSVLTRSQLERYLQPTPYLELLACACVCSSSPSSSASGQPAGIQRNQVLIIELLDQYENLGVIFPTRAHKGLLWIRPRGDWERAPTGALRTRLSGSLSSKSVPLDLGDGIDFTKTMRGDHPELSDEESSVDWSSDDEVVEYKKHVRRYLCEGRRSPVYSSKEEDDKLDASNVPGGVSDDTSLLNSPNSPISLQSPLDSTGSPTSPRRRRRKKLPSVFEDSMIESQEAMLVQDRARRKQKQRKGWMTLEQFITTQDVDYVKHFEKTLVLWARLCTDGSEKTLSRVKEEIAAKEVLLGMAMDLRSPICDCIRTAYTNVARHLYVHPLLHLDGSSSLASAQLDGVSNDTRNQLSALTGIGLLDYQHFLCHLKLIVMQTLKKNYIQVAECLPRNTFMSELLILVQEMLRCNLYTAEEMKEMLPWLLRLLDGETDVNTAAAAGPNAPHTEAIQESATLRRMPSVWLAAAARRTRKGRRKSSASGASSPVSLPATTWLNQGDSARKRAAVREQGPRGSVDQGTLAFSRYDFNEMTRLIMDTKVEVCKLLMQLMERDGANGYDFKAWIESITVGSRKGYEMLTHILLDATLYKRHPALFQTALSTLYRALSDTLGKKQDEETGEWYLIPNISEIDDGSITRMARTLLGHLLRVHPPGTPGKQQEDPYRVVTNLFRHLREVPKGDHLSIALLRTFTTMVLYPVQHAEEGVDDATTSLQLAKTQRLLDNLGLTPNITLLIESPNHDVALQGLQCGIALLEGGNRQVQSSLMDYFLSRDDEVLFMSLVYRIRSAIDFINEVEAGCPVKHRANLRRNSMQKRRMSMSPATKIMAPKILSFSLKDDARRLRGSDVSEYVVPNSPLLDPTDNDTRKHKSQMYKARNLFHTKEVMRYLQLFCEGHNTELQNYIREQGDNVHSFDLVSESLFFLQTVLQVNHMDDYMGEIVLQCFTTLTEYCQGPVPTNQLCLVHGGVCSSVNSVFQTSGYGGVSFMHISPDSQLVQQIRTAAVATTLSLLEGITDRTIPDIMASQQGLDLDVFKKKLSDVWTMKVQADEEGDEGKAEYALELGFSIFILFKTLQAYFPILSSFLEDCSGSDFFAQRTGRIEICRGSDLERVYFRIPDLCVSPGLSAKTKYELLWKVRRNTPTERIMDFFDKGEELIYEVEYTDKWFDRDSTTTTLLHKVFKREDLARSLRTLCRQYGQQAEKSLVATAILTNVAIVVADALKADGSDKGLLGIPLYENEIIFVLAAVQVWSILVAAGSFLVTEAPILAYRRYKAKHRKSRLAASPSPLEYPTELTSAMPHVPTPSHHQLEPYQAGLSSSFALTRYDGSAPGYAKLPDELTSSFTPPFASSANDTTSAMTPLERLDLSFYDDFSGRKPEVKVPPKTCWTTWKTWGHRMQALAVALFDHRGPLNPQDDHNLAVMQTCLASPIFYYFLIMLLFALLGVFVDPLFFAVHLVSIAKASDVLHNVIRAVTQNGRALILTCVLGMVVVYLFSVVAYLFFSHALLNSSGEMVCTSLIRCFLFALTHGVRSDGGLGDHMSDPDWSSKIYGFQMGFEVLFFVLVIVILLNIIFGIIIDTFAELRAQRQSVEEDIRNKCFICGIEASEFDRHADGFKHHITEDHNMWLYVFFIHHLQLKEVSEFTGQESYVYEKVRCMDLSFFPLNKAIAMDHKQTEDEDAPESRGILDLGRVLDDMDNRLTDGLLMTGKDLQEIRGQMGELTRYVRDVGQAVSQSHPGVRKKSAVHASNLTPATSAILSFVLPRTNTNDTPLI